jgi:hypothetical protein
MAVLTRTIIVRAPLSSVHELLTEIPRIPDYTQVGRVKSNDRQMVAGTRWSNEGATLKIPSHDSSIAREVSDTRIAWHTRSMVLRIIPVGADWSYALEASGQGTRITSTFEKATMFGLPIGPLIRAPFLPMLYLARGAMMAGEKKLLARFEDASTGRGP